VASLNPSLRWMIFTLVLLAWTTSTVGQPSLWERSAGSSSWAAQSSTPQRLTAQGESELRASIDSGSLAELRWSSFVDYRPQVKEFYESGGYTLAWVRDGRPTLQAQVIIEALQEADGKGLDSEDYDGSRWAERLAKLRGSPSQADLGRFDAVLTVCVMRYISDLHVGKVNPRYFHFGLDVERRNYDLADFLRVRLVGGDDVKAVLESVEPPFSEYRRTQQALRHYLELARHDDGQQLPASAKPVSPDSSYPGVTRLARLLRLLGDLPPDVAVQDDSDIYQGALVEAVMRFQTRHGLAPDGQLGARTLKELNTPLTRRVRQLQLTLERWRWLPHEFSAPPVVVNIPEFRLSAYDEQSSVALATNVIVGKAYRHQTPVFADEISYVVFRPYWNVPPGIQRSEIAPAAARDRSYLETERFEVLSRSGQVVAYDPASDEVSQQLRAGAVQVRQRPGPNNALGLVKLGFPNSFSVYLHSTPTQKLFSQPRRDFSHGCIRVERSAELTTWVLRNNPGWDLQRVEAAMQSGRDNERIYLARPIPVLILYSTAIVTEEGEARFFDDIYRLDEALEQVFAKGHPFPR